MRGAFGGVGAVCLTVWGSWGWTQVVTGPIGPDGLPLYALECSADPVESGESPCTVDRYTYVGWRVFHRSCQVCHAQDAVGSDFAPNLVNRIAQMDSPDFVAAMENGYAGEAEMPPWREDPDVRPYYFELWAYLSARASGALLPGEPRRGAERPGE